MAFPDIPTVAGNRVLFTNAVGASATRTFPSLSSPFVHNAGELLIAVVVAYQSTATANTVWSGWGASFIEFGDFSTTSTVAIGCAYKFATGSESGTFTVTQAATITGGASMMLLSIPGANDTTAPEAGSYATGTGAANPASFNPAAWDVEDTLWIAVTGNGESSATGAWGGVTAAPTNYSGFVSAATADTSTVGEIEIAAAFRQNAVAAEDVGAFTGDTSNTRDATIVIAVRPNHLFTKAGFAKESSP